MVHVNYLESSPYFDTDERIVFIEYLDIYSKRTIPAADTDEIFTISTRFHLRPDLLSNELYGTPRLWWVFAVRNMDTIIDPIYDFTAEKTIFVPSKERINNIILGA